MTKKFHFAVMLLLIAALPLSIFAAEKENPKAIEATTAPIDCPKATIAYKNQSFCNSDNTLQAVDLQGTGNYTGGTFSTTPGLNINTQTGTIMPISSTPGTYTVTYTIPASLGCIAIPVTTTVVIKPLPVILTTTPGENCGTGTVALAATATPGSIINWYMAATGGSGTSGAFFITPVIAADTTFYVEATLNGCTNTTRVPVLAEINTVPSLTIITTKCSADLKTYSIDFTSSGTAVTSTLGTVNSTTTAGVTTGTVSGITTGTNVTLTATLDGCTFDVNINAPVCNCTAPNAPVNKGDLTICETEPIPSLEVTVGVDETANWYNATGTLVGNGIAFTPTAKVTATYFAEAMDVASLCKSATRTAVTLTVNPSHRPTIVYKVCDLDLFHYAITFSSPGVVSANNGTVDNIAKTITGIQAGTDITITSTLNGCTSTLLVTAPNCACGTVNPPTSGGDKTICQGDVIPTLSASVGAGETIDWYAASTGDSPLLLDSLTYTPSAIGIYYAQTRNITDNCTSVRTPIEITENAAARTYAGAPQDVCADGTVRLNGSLGGSAFTGTWSASTGAFSNVNSLSSTYTPSIPSGVVTLTLTSNDPTGPCATVYSTVIINVLAAPTVEAGVAQVVCANGSITLNGVLNGSATAAAWSATSGTFSNPNSLTTTYTPNPNANGPVTLTLASLATLSCPAVTDTVIITVNPVATADAGAPQSVCANGTITLAGSVGGGATALGTGTWSAPSGTFSNVSSLTSTYTPSIASGVVTLTLTSNDPAGPCGVATDTVIISVNPGPILSITDPAAICSSTTVDLTASAVTSGSSAGTLTYWSDSNASTPLVNPDKIDTAGTYYIKLTSNTNCAVIKPVKVVVTISAKTSTPVSIIDTSTAKNPYAVSAVCEACDVNAIYKWSVGNQTVSNTKEYNYNNLNNGDIVMLTVINPTNCLSGETTMIVTIKRNTISGKVLYNTGNDDCATGVPYQNKAVIAKQNSYTYTGYTNKTGDYEINVPEGNYTLNVYKDANDPTTITPQNVAVVVQGASNNYINNFCLSNNSNENDIAVSMYPLNSARPGFEAKYVMYLLNRGYSYVSGTFTLKYDPTKMNFTSATPTVASNTNGILTWNYSNLAPGTALEINLVMTIITPPTVNSGTVLNYVLTGNLTLTDKNPLDNVYNYNQTVVNSYDPNDKIVVEGAYINESQATDYLHYITRFQNTGTASAINVVVKETLDSNLNWSTFEPEGSSHTGNIELKLGDQLTATFLNINLEDSTTNEPASHGWIAYKIKPKPGFAIGDVAFAKSDIYFDFNAPIITNSVSTQIQLLSNPDFENSTIQLYPNPVTDSFSINTNQEISNITVFDLNGRAVCVTKNQNNINIAALTTGLYIVEVKTINGIFRKKLIKN